MPRSRLQSNRRSAAWCLWRSRRRRAIVINPSRNEILNAQPPRAQNHRPTASLQDLCTCPLGENCCSRSDCANTSKYRSSGSGNASVDGGEIETCCDHVFSPNQRVGEKLTMPSTGYKIPWNPLTTPQSASPPLGIVATMRDRHSKHTYGHRPVAGLASRTASFSRSQGAACGRPLLAPESATDRSSERCGQLESSQSRHFCDPTTAGTAMKAIASRRPPTNRLTAAFMASSI